MALAREDSALILLSEEVSIMEDLASKTILLRWLLQTARVTTPLLVSAWLVWRDTTSVLISSASKYQCFAIPITCRLEHA